MPPDTIISVVQELRKRQVLQNALSARDDISLEPILKFIHRHVKNPKYFDELTSLLDLILDMYESVLDNSTVAKDLLQKINDRTREEVNFQKELTKLVGVMDMFIGFSNCNKV